MKGASLLETILYIGIFAVITLLTINTVLALTNAVGEIRSTRNTIREGTFTMERILREIRAAESVDTAASIFDISPGTLVLNGTSSTITFTGPLFTHLIASSSEAVRIRMTIDNKKFYGTAVLRTNYK